MFASATPDIGSQPQFAEHRPLSETMRSATPPGDILNRWVLNHRYLSIDGGETLIRLKSKTYIVSDWRSSVISVEGWGLKIPLTNSNQIRREMGSSGNAAEDSLKVSLLNKDVLCWPSEKTCP